MALCICSEHIFGDSDTWAVEDTSLKAMNTIAQLVTQALPASRNKILVLSDKSKETWMRSVDYTIEQLSAEGPTKVTKLIGGSIILKRRCLPEHITRKSRVLRNNKTLLLPNGKATPPILIHHGEL